MKIFLSKNSGINLWVILVNRAPVYADIYVRLGKFCYRYGYAVCVHGTMQRDLDLVLIPWAEDSISREEMIEKIRKKYDIRERKGWDKASDKPHGRKAYIVQLHGFEGGYLDISIMPRENDCDKG